MCIRDRGKYCELKTQILFILIQNTLFDDNLLNIDDILSIVNQEIPAIGKSTIRKILAEMVNSKVPVNRKRDGHQYVYSLDLEALSKFLENN